MSAAIDFPFDRDVVLSPQPMRPRALRPVDPRTSAAELAELTPRVTAGPANDLGTAPLDIAPLGARPIAPVIALPGCATVRAHGAGGLRLTGRGRRVVALAVLACAAVLVGAAQLSHPGPSPVTPVSYSSIVVQPGDTVWSIAERVAPTKDPRAEVELLRRLNHLTSVQILPGEVLHLN